MFTQIQQLCEFFLNKNTKSFLIFQIQLFYKNHVNTISYALFKKNVFIILEKFKNMKNNNVVIEDISMITAIRFLEYQSQFYCIKKKFDYQVKFKIINFNCCQYKLNNNSLENVSDVKISTFYKCNCPDEIKINKCYEIDQDDKNIKSKHYFDYYQEIKRIVVE
jgi:hypothetical protein